MTLGGIGKSLHLVQGVNPCLRDRADQESWPQSSVSPRVFPVAARNGAQQELQTPTGADASAASCLPMGPAPGGAQPIVGPCEPKGLKGLCVEIQEWVAGSSG